jgi:hypothetical protein
MLGAGSVVRLLAPKRSPVTEDTSEYYVAWHNCVGQEFSGWLPANVTFTQRRTSAALQYRSCDTPMERVSPWAQLRWRWSGGAGRLTFSQWLQNTRTKKEAAVLALIVREFGGRVTEHDDVRTLATRIRRMVIPHVGLSKESQMQLSTQKSSKGTPIILPSSSKKSTPSGKGKKTASKKTAVAKKGKKTATQHIGRASKFAGCTFKKLVKENPRNAGSVGHKMWDKLRTGMTYEQYIANGGGRSHLAWDIAHGHVKVIRASK